MWTRLVALAFSLFWIECCAAAISQVDQSNVVSTSSTLYHDVASIWPTAQTFRMGTTGFITRIDVEVYRQGQTTLPLLFDLRPTSAGVPVDGEGSSLFSTSLDALNIPQIRTTVGYTQVDLSGAAIYANAGDVFAITLRSDEPDTLGHYYLWHCCSQFANTYPNGAIFEEQSGGAWNKRADDTDGAFISYVLAPEAGSLAGVMGLVCVGLVRRRNGLLVRC